jgi:hypothetical protein
MDQYSRVNSNDKSVYFLFCLVLFIHFGCMGTIVFLLSTRKMRGKTQQAVTIGYLFGNNSLSTQKNETNCSKQSKRLGGQCAALQIESQAIADLHISRSLHTFCKHGQQNTRFAERCT